MKNKLIITVLRVVLGLILTAHGIAKLQMGVDNVAGWFGSIGLPGFAAYVVTYLELIGGIALLVGFASRYISIGFVLLFIGAIVSVKLSAGLLGTNQNPGYELDLALMVMALYFVVADEQGYGVDQLINKREGSTTSF